MGTLKGTGRETKKKEKDMANETILWAYNQHDVVCSQKYEYKEMFENLEGLLGIVR